MPNEGFDSVTPLCRIFYRPQTKFAKVMFSQVSVCPQGGVSKTPLVSGEGGRPTQADTPLADTPWETHLLADTPPHSACWDMVNKQAVRIPPECILVCECFNPLEVLFGVKIVSIGVNDMLRAHKIRKMLK